MIIIGLILSIFFILVIVLLCRTYTKDIFELENRILQLEKRINECEHISHEYKDVLEILFEHLEVLNLDTYNKLKNMKEGDGEMACKGKGKGGKRK